MTSLERLRVMNFDTRSLIERLTVLTGGLKFGKSTIRRWLSGQSAIPANVENVLKEALAFCLTKAQRAFITENKVDLNFCATDDCMLVCDKGILRTL